MSTHKPIYEILANIYAREDEPQKESWKTQLYNIEWLINCQVAAMSVGVATMILMLGGIIKWLTM